MNRCPFVCITKVILWHSFNKLKDFVNVKQIFVCKLPPRSDIATVNVKVNLYNQLISSKCSEMNSVHVVETIPLERKLFYKDGLHFSDLGLDKQCKLYSLSYIVLLLCTWNVNMHPAIVPVKLNPTNALAHPVRTRIIQSPVH